MHPEHSQGPRDVRAKALPEAHANDNGALYVDAAKFKDKEDTYVAVAIRATTGEIYSACSVRAKQAHQAEEAAIAFALTDTKIQKRQRPTQANCQRTLTVPYRPSNSYRRSSGCRQLSLPKRAGTHLTGPRGDSLVEKVGFPGVSVETQLDDCILSGSKRALRGPLLPPPVL
ncbi:hypothetical protein MRX96_057397 [Rhipicephalus microplus]